MCCFLGGGCLHETLPQTKTGDPCVVFLGGLFTWNPSTNKDWWPVVVFLGGGLFTWNPSTNKDWWPVCCFLGGVVYNKFLKIFVSPQGPANKDWEPVCCFLGGGGCLQQILKDICFSPGACKQRLGTRVLFSWGGGVVYNKFLKIFVSPQGPANKDWWPVCCFLGGGLFTTNS